MQFVQSTQDISQAVTDLLNAKIVRLNTCNKNANKNLFLSILNALFDELKDYGIYYEDFIDDVDDVYDKCVNNPRFNRDGYIQGLMLKRKGFEGATLHCILECYKDDFYKSYICNMSYSECPDYDFMYVIEDENYLWHGCDLDDIVEAAAFLGKMVCDTNNKYLTKICKNSPTSIGGGMNC